MLKSTRQVVARAAAFLPMGGCLLDRRQFLSLAGLVAARTLWAPPDVAWATKSVQAIAASPPPPKTSKSAATRAEALEIARKQILTYCATVAFPNGAIHAVRALGRQCPLGPGDPYVIVLESFLVETPVGERVYLEVPVEREGHRNAMLKTLLEKGCEPN